MPRLSPCKKEKKIISLKRNVIVINQNIHSLMGLSKPKLTQGWTTLRKGETNNGHKHKRNGASGCNNAKMASQNFLSSMISALSLFVFTRWQNSSPFYLAKPWAFPPKRKAPQKMAYLALFPSPKNVTFSCLSQNRLANLPPFQMSKCQPS